MTWRSVKCAILMVTTSEVPFPSDFFPYLGETLAVDAEIPFTKIPEGSGPYLIARVLESFRQFGQELASELRTRVFATQMGEGMQHDVLHVALVGEPLDVFERILEHAPPLVAGFIFGFGVHEDDHAVFDLFLDFLLLDLIECLREGLPPEPAGLKTEEFHEGFLNEGKQTT